MVSKKKLLENYLRKMIRTEIKRLNEQLSPGTWATDDDIDSVISQKGGSDDDLMNGEI